MHRLVLKIKAHLRVTCRLQATGFLLSICDRWRGHGGTRPTSLHDIRDTDLRMDRKSNRIIGIDHVQITIPVGQEETARAFYCGVLGLTEIRKPEALAGRGGFWLALGDLQIHIGTEDGVDRLRTKAHIAYRVTDISFWRDRLEAAGCTILESVPIPGVERFETRDPFGNRIEFISSVL
jgi:catechol 2,3-dioxygenase-like lactoylglutathione lyase family enzyme